MSSRVEEHIKGDNAILVNINKSTIEFLCNCGTNHTKSKRALDKSGAFCKDCTQRNTSIKKIKNKIALNNSLLAQNHQPPNSL